MFTEADLIHSYTRAEALADGALIDVSEMGREAGLRVPVAMTSAAYGAYVALPPNYSGFQDVEGRLWDVLFMLHASIGAANESTDTIHYRLHVRRIKADGSDDNRTPPRVTLKSVIGPGDDGAPVLTIMLPDED